MNQSFHSNVSCSKSIDFQWFAINQWRLILEHKKNFSLTVERCSWCQQILLFKMWTQLLCRILLKGSGLVSGCWVLFVSMVLVGCPLLACMHHLQLQQSCHHISCYHLTWKQEGLGHEELVLWQKEHQSIEHGARYCNLFLLDLSCRNSSL